MENFTNEDLETIYLALNSKCVELSEHFNLYEKEKWTGIQRFYYDEWVRIGDLQSKVYDLMKKGN